MFNKNLASDTLMALYNNKIGYRNDNLYNSGEIDFEKVIKHEILELGNTDIISTVSKLYSLAVDESNLERAVTIITAFLKAYFKTNKLYAKWFTDEINTLIRYGDDYADFYISVYKIPSNSLPISDLDKNGVLFVSPQKFELINAFPSTDYLLINWEDLIERLKEGLKNEKIRMDLINLLDEDDRESVKEIIENKEIGELTLQDYECDDYNLDIIIPGKYGFGYYVPLYKVAEVLYNKKIEYQRYEIVNYLDKYYIVFINNSGIADDKV